MDAVTEPTLDVPIPVRIVIAIDDPKMSAVLTTALGAFGMVVAGSTGDGIEACSLFRQHRPQVVLLDARLSGQDGLSTLKEIKGLDRTTFVVLLSSLHEEPERRRALELGIDGFLCRPVRADELFRDIRETFSSVLPDSRPMSLDQEYVRYVKEPRPEFVGVARPSPPPVAGPVPVETSIEPTASALGAAPAVRSDSFTSSIEPSVEPLSKGHDGDGPRDHGRTEASFAGEPCFPSGGKERIEERLEVALAENDRLRKQLRMVLLRCEELCATLKEILEPRRDEPGA